MPRTLPAISLLLLVFLPLAGGRTASAQECPADDLAPALSAISDVVPQLDARWSRVPLEVQEATLETILARVRERAAAHARNAAEPRGVVQIDLDYTSFVPRRSERAALAVVGQRFDVPELLDPESLPILPGYTARSWNLFLDESGLRAAHPGVDWDAALRVFDDAGYRLLPQGLEDLTPGLADFTRRVADAGGVVVFNTGRRESMREEVLGVLARGGVSHPNLVMKPEHSRLSTEEAKAAAQDAIRARYGRTVAVIDDLGANRDLVARAAGGEVMEVPIALPGYETELTTDELATHPFRIATFEMAGGASR